MGSETTRRRDLVHAAIAEIAARGTGPATVGAIAARAGVSPALAFHYFGTKERLFDAALRGILAVFGQEVRAALHGATDPRARLDAVLRASFAPSNFAPATMAAWLQFYAAARTDPGAARLLRVYRRRLRSNLLAGLRPLDPGRAEALAEELGALIDGLYLRAALEDAPDPARALKILRRRLDRLPERT